MSPLDNPVLLVRRLLELPAETEWLEFKHDNADPVRIGRDICALANAATYYEVRYAYKIWGVDDRTHAIVGTTFNPLTAKKGNQPLEMWLRLQLSSNVQFEFESVLIDEKQVVLLRVWPAMYQIALFCKVPYMRSGSSTHELQRGSALEAGLWRKVQHEVFEIQVARASCSRRELFDLLDVGVYFSKQGLPVPTNEETIVHYLVDEGLVIPEDDGSFAITNMGALLFAITFDEFPAVARKAARVIQYEGSGRISMLKSRTFSEGYAVCLDKLVDYIMTLLPSREVIVRATRTTQSQLPALAVRELIANALVHQDFAVTGAGPLIELFDDRLEVTNPGTPLVDVTRIVNDPPRARNEKLAALMRRLGFCEEAGSGWDKVIEACEYFTLPAPRIETPGDNMRVTLFASKPFRDLTQDERTMACYWHTCIQYANKSAATNQSLRDRFGLPSSAASQVSRLIRDCIEAGLIRQMDPSASKKNMRYVPAWA